VRPGRRREALAALARKTGRASPPPTPGADRGGEQAERPERVIGERPNGENASSATGPSADLRVLPRDTGGLLYRWFLLYRQDIQRV
jgi:hypothetical protein